MTKRKAKKKLNRIKRTKKYGNMHKNNKSGNGFVGLTDIQKGVHRT